MSRYRYKSDRVDTPALGLVVLQADETLEGDFRAMLADDVPFYVSRVASGLEVTAETLDAMAAHLTDAAALFPVGRALACVGYGCTSGTAQIGAGRVAALVQAGAQAECVTEPVSALIAAARALGLRKIALLSPYVAPVSARLRAVLAQAGIDTPLFGSFDEAEEARVARIRATSIIDAATDLVRQGGVDGLFLSCTNLRTLPVIDALEAQVQMPVLSSNQVLAWHMGQLARVSVSGPGRLFKAKA